MTCWTSTASRAGPNSPERVQVARVNGIELHFTDTGDGATAILLHGGMGDLESWPHQVRALSTRYRVIAYSRRRSHPNRNGDSPCACFADIVDDDIDDLLALQATLRAGPAHLIGTSYGALLALAVALRAPSQVASLVLAEPPLHRWACATEAGSQLYGAFIDGAWRTAAEAFRRGLSCRAMQLLTDGMWGRPLFGSWPQERIDAVMRNAAAMKALVLSHDPFPQVERTAVAGLTMPTLLLQGQLTSALHRQVMHELGVSLRNAKRAEIPFACHGSPNENPEAFTAAVVFFLESLRRSAIEPR
jgi:pimeloyl-ACP methyl ester carboxylesterase